MKKTSIVHVKKALKNLPNSFKTWFDAEKKCLISNIKKDSKVLFVGCGDGREIKYILKNTKNITGLDHNKDAVNKAKQIFKKYPKIKIIFGEATNLPFRDKSFDYVLCMGVFMNLGKNKISSLKEMKRVLKNEGKIILDTYSENAMAERIKLYKKIGAPILKIKGTTVYLDYKMSDNISEQFSKKQLIWFFNKAKLEVESIKKVSIVYICVLFK